MRELIQKRYERCRASTRGNALAFLNGPKGYNAFLQDAVKASPHLRGISKMVDLEQHSLLGGGLYVLTVPIPKMQDAIGKLTRAGHAVTLLECGDMSAAVYPVVTIPAVAAVKEPSVLD